ncbi:hypothetical protein [Brevundimonas sp. DC300-4]|uniref:hypothetical protein n=1 Tax=Brevundimonas sp. DC300-4 TaxID=2804594 RepID=UPI003CE98EDB
MEDEIVFPKRTGRSDAGQFVKGYSGNLSGRPRSKHQRAASSRQYRRDILAVTEELVPIRTSAGVTMVPFHVANLLSIRSRASQGHAPSQRYIDQRHREAIADHEEANPQLTQLLEASERNAVNKSVDCLENSEWKELNLVRKYSWRL